MSKIDKLNADEKRTYQEGSSGQENLFDELVPTGECSEQDRSY